MCDRISWKELQGGTLLYLDTYALFDTKRGKELREQYANPEDWWGHSAIAFYYTGKTKLEDGKDNECADFRSPSRFPPEIAQGIEDGRFLDVTSPLLLTRSAWSGWASKYPQLSKAYANCRKADADWQKAYANYRKADADWQKAYLYDVNKECPAQRAFWKLFSNPKNRARAWRDSKKVNKKIPKK